MEGWAKGGKGHPESAYGGRRPHFGTILRGSVGNRSGDTCFPELFFLRNKYSPGRAEGNRMAGQGAVCPMPCVTGEPNAYRKGPFW